MVAKHQHHFLTELHSNQYFMGRNCRYYDLLSNQTYMGSTVTNETRPPTIATKDLTPSYILIQFGQLDFQQRDVSPQYILSSHFQICKLSRSNTHLLELTLSAMTLSMLAVWLLSDYTINKRTQSNRTYALIVLMPMTILCELTCAVSFGDYDSPVFKGKLILEHANFSLTKNILNHKTLTTYYVINQNTKV